jgi:hypothetical protein
MIWQRGRSPPDLNRRLRAKVAFVADLRAHATPARLTAPRVGVLGLNNEARSACWIREWERPAFPFGRVARRVPFLI